MGPNTASTVPPFIPGLLIVSGLILISILIAWRNYVRRGVPRVVPGIGVNEWNWWDLDATTGADKGEKPKLWEVGVGRREQSKKAPDEAGWDKIMPLSATSLTPEPPPRIIEPIPDPTPLPPASRFSRLNFFSSPPKAVAPPPPIGAPIVPHRLQVSVLISMPSLNSPKGTRSRPISASSLPQLNQEIGNEAPPRSSTSSSLHKGVAVDAQEEEGAPDVAFGIVVLPYKDAGQTDITT